MEKIVGILCCLVICLMAEVCFAHPHVSREETPHNTLIKNVELLDTPNGEMYNIAIAGRKIMSVSREVPADFVPDLIVDGKGKLATPGMVNTHGHVSMTLLRSFADDLELHTWLNDHIWPAEAKMDKEDMYWGAMLGIAEMLKGGTTCFADMYFNSDDIAEACDTLGIRANISDTLMSVRPTAEKDLEQALKVFEKWHGYDDGRIRVTVSPHAPYTNSDEFLLKVIAAAKESKAELQIHLCETKSEIEDSQRQYGVTPIERMEKLGLFQAGTIASHCVYLTPQDMEILARNKVRVAHNPQSNLKLASGIADVNGMLRHGILVGIGTDGASSNNNLDLLEEIRLTAMLHKIKELNAIAVPALEAWKMGTKDGAKVLGFENLGELKAGQYADIVLWDMDKPYWYPRTNKLNLLVYAANSSDVDTVFVNGRKVVEGGRLTTFDEARIYEEASRHSEKLLK